MKFIKILSNLRTFSKKSLGTNPFTINLPKGVTAMKTRNMFIRCLLLVMLIVGLAACGSTSKQSGPGEYVDDSVITTKVKSSLLLMIFSSHLRSVWKPTRASFN